MVKSILTILFSLTLITPVGAQVASSTTSTSGGFRDSIRSERERVIQANTNLREQLREAVKTGRQNLNDSLDALRGERKEDAKLIRATTSSSTLSRAEQFKQVRENFTEKRKEVRQDFKKAIDAKIASTTDAIRINKEKLQSQIKGIKDEQKKAAVVRVADSLNKLNQQQTQHFVDYLNKLDEILSRIGTRALKAEQAHINVDVVKTDSAAAANLIASARAAVAVQAGKVYTFSVPPAIVASSSATSTTSTTSTVGTTNLTYLKDNMGQARQALHSDLVALRSKLFAARDAVHKAAIDLGQINGIDDLDNTSSTATSTATTTVSTTTATTTVSTTSTSTATTTTSTNQ